VPAQYGEARFPVLEVAIGLAHKVDTYQRRHSWVGFPLGVIYKYFDDQGAYLGALMTYYGFLSIFPLLLLLVTALGYILENNPHLQKTVLDSALGQFPGMAEQIGDTVKPITGSSGALIAGTLIALYGGIGIAQAAQNSMSRAWGIPRNRRPNPFKSRLRSLIFLLVLGLALLATTTLSILTGRVGALGANLGEFFNVVILVATIAVNWGLFLAAYRVLTVRPTTFGEIFIGALLAAIGWQLLQRLGDLYIQHVVSKNNAYGVFAVVLGLIGYIYLAAAVVVIGAEVNVVRAQRLWPRSLLTPFTDQVELTDADRRAYRSYSARESRKGFQRVSVEFDEVVQELAPTPDTAALLDEPTSGEMAYWDGQYESLAGEPVRDASPAVVSALTDVIADRLGLALDLGCGDGRHAIWLAAQGCSVTAVDFSVRGLARALAAEATARQAGDGRSAVAWVADDVRIWSPPGPADYDVCLVADLQPDVGEFDRFRSWLRPHGGTLVVVGPAAGSEDQSPDDNSGWTETTLRAAAGDWEIVRLSEAESCWTLIARSP
jgi:membrane protein